MNLTTLHRRRAERFAQLLDEADGGCRHHVRSRSDARLSELVAIGHQTCALRPTVELDPEFRTGLRALLVATAERDGIGVTASAEPEPASAARRPAIASGRPSRIRARGAVIIGVAVGAIAVSGMSAASENAVPGDALYGVKRSTERAQLALASSDVTRGQLYLDFARTRVAEAGAVRRDQTGFASVLNDMDADTRQGSRLLATSAIAHGDPAALDAIGSFVTVQRLALGGLLEQGPSANRSRTLESLALLDSVADRADALRPMLSCGDAQGVGSDRLGPKPRQCGTGAPAGSDSGPANQDRPAGRDAPSHRRTEASTAEPSATPASPSPAAEAPVPAEQPLTTNDPAEPVAPASAPPTTQDGVLGEVGRILGDLLG